MLHKIVITMSFTSKLLKAHISFGQR